MKLLNSTNETQNSDLKEQYSMVLHPVPVPMHTPLLVLVHKRKQPDQTETPTIFRNFLGTKRIRNMAPDKSQESERKRIEGFSIYTKEEEIEEARLGVSTKLKLFEDPWRIKKVLSESDVNSLCRFMLPTRTVVENVLAFWSASKNEEVYTGKGASIMIWDYDTNDLGLEPEALGRELVLKKWKSNKSFIFGHNWTAKFVKRRNLTVGDEIGLFWDGSKKRFGFRVLTRGFSD